MVSLIPDYLTLGLIVLVDRDLASKITQEQRDEAIRRLEVYRQWFLREVMQAKKYNTIVIIPIENISPRYRDEAK